MLLCFVSYSQNWQLVWSDEFNGSGSPGSNWSREIWNPDPDDIEKGVYLVSVYDGKKEQVRRTIIR